MAIGRDPREWVAEMMGVLGFVILAITAYSRSNLMLGIASVMILLLTIYLANLRIEHDISVRPDE